MLDDFVRRSTRLYGGTFHDEIDRAQRQILDIQTVGDRRLVLEDYASLEGLPRDRLGQEQVTLLARQGISGIALGRVHKRDSEGRAGNRRQAWVARVSTTELFSRRARSAFQAAHGRFDADGP